MFFPLFLWTFPFIFFLSFFFLVWPDVDLIYMVNLKIHIELMLFDFIFLFSFQYDQTSTWFTWSIWRSITTRYFSFISWQERFIFQEYENFWANMLLNVFLVLWSTFNRMIVEDTVCNFLQWMNCQLYLTFPINLSLISKVI